MTVNCHGPFLFTTDASHYPRKTKPLLSSRYRHFPASITIKHWQLRDLVSTTNWGPHRGSALYPCDKELRELDFESGHDRVLVELPFDARCLASGDHNVVAAAGLNDSARHTPKGTFALYNESTRELASHELGDYINNSVAVYNQDSSRLSAAVCNNDHNVYFLDVCNSGGAMTTCSSLNLGFALNHSAVSPDGKTAVILGDSPKIAVAHSDSRGGYDWHVTANLHSTHDLGFSVAFHPSGTLFAAAFQKGVANLYDIRNTSRPLTMIYSTRPGDMSGAFRALKFTTGSEDLVFLSEQNDRVHIVDLRDFDCHQILNVPTLSPTGHDSYFEAYTTNEIVRHDDQSDLDDSDLAASEKPLHDSHSSFSPSSSSPSSHSRSSPARSSSHSSSHPSSQSHMSAPPHRRNSSVSSAVSDTSTIQCYEDIVDTPSYTRLGSGRTFDMHHPYFSPSLAPRGLAIASGSSPIPMRVHTGLATGESGLSGLAWSEYGSGSLVIGTSRGIGVWNIDGWGRRTFPSFSIR